jgi:hypothetical protein
VTWIDGTGYVVSPLDGVNGVRHNLLARIGLAGVAACQAREDAAAAPRSPFQPTTCLWQFEGLSVKHGPSDRFAANPGRSGELSFWTRIGYRMGRREAGVQPTAKHHKDAGLSGIIFGGFWGQQ